MAVLAPDIRAQVVNGLHGPIADLVRTVDAVEMAIKCHLEMPGATLTPQLRSVLARLIQSRDTYLTPLVARAREGEA